MFRPTHARLAILLLIALGLPAAVRAQSADESFFFLHLADPQFGMFTDNADFAQETTNFDFVIATANRLRPAFVVVAGDLVQRPGDEAQIAEYERIAARLDPAIPPYNVAGNHDVENEPTPASVGAWRERFGPDYYRFDHGDFTGIVLNSSVIHSPDGAPGLLAEQEAWLRSELARRVSGPFEEFGVTHVFAGHYHRNALGRAGELEMVTSGPVGMPLGEAKSGIRVVVVRDGAIEHRYYELGEIPNSVDLSASPGGTAPTGAR
jgi:3',5'-cyclic AMP phosphodiesterase CpdA